MNDANWLFFIVFSLHKINITKPVDSQWFWTLSWSFFNFNRTVVVVMHLILCCLETTKYLLTKSSMNQCVLFIFAHILPQTQAFSWQNWLGRCWCVWSNIVHNFSWSLLWNASKPGKRRHLPFHSFHQIFLLSKLISFSTSVLMKAHFDFGQNHLSIQRVEYSKFAKIKTNLNHIDWVKISMWFESNAKSRV